MAHRVLGRSRCFCIPGITICQALVVSLLYDMSNYSKKSCVDGHQPPHHPTTPPTTPLPVARTGETLSWCRECPACPAYTILCQGPSHNTALGSDWDTSDSAITLHYEYANWPNLQQWIASSCPCWSILKVRLTVLHFFPFAFCFF